MKFLVNFSGKPINNKIIIITAPSGAGKTSITHHLMHQFPQLAFSVSAATRQARGNEKNGVDYYFMSAEEFKQKIQHNEFVEWEMVYEGKYYGTLKSEMERIWNNETAESLAARVNKASYEISFKDQFDKQIVNDDLQQARDKAAAIVAAFINNQ